jgi:hypothetical protein
MAILLRKFRATDFVKVRQREEKNHAAARNAAPSAPLSVVAGRNG